MIGLVTAGTVALFAAVWTLICFVCSRISGWRALADAFPGQPDPAAQRFLGVSGWLGRIPYRRLLIVSISAQGIGLRLLPLAGLFAPPLLIPWSQIERVRQLRMLGTTTHYEVNLRGGRHTLGVLGKVGPAIHQAWVEHAGRS